jgi:hypothetical protein
MGVKERRPSKMLLFIDFQKAFDSVNRTLLIEILPKYIIDKNVRSLIQELLQPQEIFLSKKVSFKATEGVPQGLTSSPMLFAIYMDYLLKKENLLYLEILAYADDLVFITNSTGELNHIIQKFESLFKFLQLNKRKCGIL